VPGKTGRLALDGKLSLPTGAGGGSGSGASEKPVIEVWLERSGGRFPIRLCRARASKKTFTWGLFVLPNSQSVLDRARETQR